MEEEVITEIIATTKAMLPLKELLEVTLTEVETLIILVEVTKTLLPLQQILVEDKRLLPLQQLTMVKKPQLLEPQILEEFELNYLFDKPHLKFIHV